MLSRLLLNNSVKLLSRLSPVSVKRLSTEPAVIDDKENKKRIARAYKPYKVRELKKFKEHFIQNLFCGKYDREILEYPEVIDQEDTNAALRKAVEIQERLSTDIDSKEIDRTGVVPEHVMEILKELELFGLKVPREYEGLDLSETEYALIMEALGHDASISSMIADNQDAGIKAIKFFGTEEQKQQYLPSLATGDKITCFAYYENLSVTDIASYHVYAELSDDGKYFTISGKKQNVCNAQIADTMILLAKTQTKDDKGEMGYGLTAFLIDKNTKGITVGPPMDKIGVRALDLCEVSLDKVVVPVENILGEHNKGVVVLLRLLGRGKFNIGPQCIGLIKKLLNEIIHNSIQNNYLDAPVSDNPLVQGQLGEMCARLYALEAMTYLIAGSLDRFDEPDVFLESCCVKVFATETLHYIMEQYFQFFGKAGYIRTKNNEFMERLLRDAPFLSIHEEPNVLLKIAIANIGLAHSGLETSAVIRIIRSPHINPLATLKQKWNSRTMFTFKPKLKLKLKEYLHPSLEEPADQLEACVLMLESAAEWLLVDHGIFSLEKQYELLQLGNIVILIYALTAALGRASRSYCIGLRSGDNEIAICRALAAEVELKVQCFYHLLTNEPNQPFPYYKCVGEDMFRRKQYAFDHPTSRNF